MSSGHQIARRCDEAVQHPLGLAVSGTTLYVADTYNSKIKRVDTANDSITSWLGDESGWDDGSSPLFDEPGGLSIDNGTLYVADTNNHTIRLIDINTSVTTTLVLKGVEAFDPPAEYNAEVIFLSSELFPSMSESRKMMGTSCPEAPMYE